MWRTLLLDFRQKDSEPGFEGDTSLHLLFFPQTTGGLSLSIQVYAHLARLSTGRITSIALIQSNKTIKKLEHGF